MKSRERGPSLTPVAFRGYEIVAVAVLCAAGAFFRFYLLERVSLWGDEPADGRAGHVSGSL